MANLNINGNTVSVDDSFLKLSPDEQNSAVDEIAASLPKQLDAAPQPDAGTLNDIAKSIPSALVKGAIGVAGIPGDAIKAADSIIGAALGSNPAAGGVPGVDTITSPTIQGQVEKVTGPLYDAQTTPGKYVQSVVGLAPALVGGPEGLATKLLTRAVIPGVASEAAGQATEGTSLEPAARIGAALLGATGASAAAGKIANASAAAKVAKITPTEAELDAASSGPGQGYNSPAIAQVQFAPQVGPSLAGAIKQKLLASKVDDLNAPGLVSVVNRLNQPRFGQNLTIADLEAARQDATINPASATNAEKRGAPIVKDTIDTYLKNIPQSHLVAGNAAAANDALTQARSNFAALKRSQDITAAMGRGETQAGSSYSGGNIENATRQQLRPILNQKLGIAKQSGFQDYTDQEIGALKDAVNGNVVGNTIRTLGGLLGRGHGLGSLGAGYAAFEAADKSGYSVPESIAIGIATGLTGRGLGILGNKLEVNRAAAAGQMLRTRSALAASRGIAPGGYQPTSILGGVPPLPNLALQGLLASRLQQQYQPGQ